jgi:hypothetical protein
MKRRCLREVPMWKPIVLTLVAAGSLAYGAGAQDRKHGDRRTIVVTGCVERSWLKVRKSDSDGTHVDRFKLRGSKDLIKALTGDHDRHLVEVTGLLTDPGNTQGVGKSVQLGKKNRVYTGAREVPDRPPVVDPLLDVQAFRVISDSCAGAH